MLIGFVSIGDPRITTALMTLDAARRSRCVGCMCCDLARAILKEMSWGDQRN